MVGGIEEKEWIMGFKNKINNKYLDLGDLGKEYRFILGIINKCLDKEYG